jgi:hypothetical protein
MRYALPTIGNNGEIPNGIIETPSGCTMSKRRAYFRSTLCNLFITHCDV